MIIDCDRLWTRLVTAVYKVRRLPRVTNDPPPIPSPPARKRVLSREPGDEIGEADSPVARTQAEGLPQ